MGIAGKESAVLLIVVCFSSAYVTCRPSAGEITGVRIVPSGGDKLVGLWTLNREFSRKFQVRDASVRTVVVKPNPFSIHLQNDGSPGANCESTNPWCSTCWVTRQVGTSLTLAVEVNESSSKRMQHYDVQWFQRFKLQGEPNVLCTEVDKDNLPMNMALGSGGRELRLRPVHSFDMDLNSFRAVVSRSRYPGSQPEFVGNITFRIQQIPVDMGVKNAGEEMKINILDHLSLPSKANNVESVGFQWRLERGSGLYLPLPSNMQPSSTGMTLSVRGLRLDQSGILSCAVFDSAGIFFAKKRFQIRVRPDNEIHRKKTDDRKEQKDAKLPT